MLSVAFIGRWRKRPLVCHKGPLFNPPGRAQNNADSGRLLVEPFDPGDEPFAGWTAMNAHLNEWNRSLRAEKWNAISRSGVNFTGTNEIRVHLPLQRVNSLVR